MQKLWLVWCCFYVCWLPKWKEDSLNSTYLVNSWPKTSPVIDTSRWPLLTTLCVVFVGHCQISPTNFKEKSAKMLTLPVSSLSRVLPSCAKKSNSAQDPERNIKNPVELYEIQINSFAHFVLSSIQTGNVLLVSSVFLFSTKWWNIINVRNRPMLAWNKYYFLPFNRKNFSQTSYT